MLQVSGPLLRGQVEVSVKLGWLETDLGGPNADNEVDTVMPGALVPALLEDNSSRGIMFRAQDYK